MLDGQEPHRRRLLITASLVTIGAAAAAIAISPGAPERRGTGAAKPTADQVAEDRCRTDVLERLVSSSTAQLSDVRAEPSTLDAAGRDLFPLTLEEPLKGVDPSRISVLNVSGVVNAPSEVGSTLHDPFDCRAYFVDGTLAHTLVLFDHEH